MKTEEKIDRLEFLRLSRFITPEDRPLIAEAIELFKRFEGAVVMIHKTDPYADECYCWLQAKYTPAKTPKNYTLYAVPKER